MIQLKSDITVTPIQSMGGDHMVVAAARVSVCGAEAAKYATPSAAEGNTGLIRFLMKQRHGTPFEHASITFFTRAPIFVYREWHRHRIGMCIAGDSKIWLAPGGKHKTIAEIYRNWYEGVPDRMPFSTRRGVAFDKQTGKWRAQGKRNGSTVSLGRYENREDAIAVRKEWEEENPTLRLRLLPSCKNLRARVVDEDSLSFTTGRMSEVIRSGVKELYSVKTEFGHSLHASKDHRILTPYGWAKVEELKKGDRIAVVGRRSKNAERQIPPSLRRGIGVWTSMQRNRLIEVEDKCYICQDGFNRENLILDHVIPVAADLTKALDVRNLKPLCKACNKLKTAGEQKLAKRGCIAGVKFAKLADTPSRVSEEMTYDICMEGPHYNFIANDVVVHNSYNEESGRYKKLDPVFWIPRRDRAMVPVEGWKPGRPKFLTLDEYAEQAQQKALNEGNAMGITASMLADSLYESLVARKRRAYNAAWEAYEDSLGDNIALEVARSVLPVGIYSSCWVTMNPRSLMHFLSLRTHEPEASFVSYPQAEIEEAARAVEEVFKQGWPITYQAFNDFGRVAP